jgi:FkbM family methyltransferase
MNFIKSRIKRRFNQFKIHPLTKENYYITCIRYLGYNIYLRLFPSLTYRWLSNLKFQVRRGDAGIIGNIYYGLYEYKESIFLLHVLRKEDCFLDVGANVGHFSLLVSGIHSCKTLALEPVPETFNQLKKNIHLNRLNNLVEPLNIGLGSIPTKLYFSIDLGTMNKVVSENHQSKVKVEVSTLDKFIEFRQIPFAMKIDAEGYEKFIIEGGKEMLINPELNVVIVELNELSSFYEIDLNDILMLLENAGFKSYDYIPESRNLVPLTSYNKEQFNSIFIKDIDLIKERIKSARKIRVRNHDF